MKAVSRLKRVVGTVATRRATSTAEPAPICVSVLEWALAHPGTKVRRLHPPSRVVKAPLRTIEPVMPELFAQSRKIPSYTVPEKYLARLHGTRLVSNLGLVVLSDGSFASEAIYNAGHLAETPAYHAPLPARFERKRGNYYSLLIEYGINGTYYHWLHDVLLRLYGIMEHLPADTQFVVPPGLGPVHQETLALVGVDPGQLVEFDGTRVWAPENLYFSPPVPETGLDSPDADVWLRDLALDTYGVTLGPARRRIYVSRRGARHRRIVNEEAVEGYLVGLGFEVHHLEHYRFGEQVALLAEAAVLVGAHGAGQTNMLFAPPGLIVIDIFEPTLVNKCFWNMSGALGHDYWFTCGASVMNNTRYAADILVDLDKLAAVLEEALAHGTAS